MVFLAFGKMQFNVQGVTHNLIPQIENNWFKDLLRCPAHISGNGKWNWSKLGRIKQVRQVITFEQASE